MSDKLLHQVRELTEGQIDFEGQKLSELIATGILAVVGAVTFVVGYFLQDIKLTLYIGLAGTALAFIAVVPPWPVFNKNPVQWLNIAGSEMTSQGVSVDGQAVG